MLSRRKKLTKKNLVCSWLQISEKKNYIVYWFWQFKTEKIKIKSIDIHLT